MLHVYVFTGCDVFIIDTTKNVMHKAYAYEITDGKEDYETKKITKATIRKHDNDRGYVIIKFILSHYAPGEMSEYERKDADREYIGSFDSYDYLWKVVIGVRQGKTEEVYNRSGLKKEKEMALFRVLSKA